MPSASAMWPVAPAMGHDAFLGEIRGLWGAEHSLLAALQAWASPALPEQPRDAVVAIAAHAGARLARLEQVCELLRERPSGRHSRDMWRIFERYAPPRAAGLGADEASVRQLFAALHQALGYLNVAYALAASRARTARLTQAAQLLGAAQDDARLTAALTSAVSSGECGVIADARPVATFPAVVRAGRRGAAPSAGPRPTRRTAFRSPSPMRSPRL